MIRYMCSNKYESIEHENKNESAEYEKESNYELSLDLDIYI